jgi:hypothetical protein
VTVVVSVGCGGDGGDPSATTRPPNDKTIVTLTEGERKGFCDDLAAIEGGYSHPRELTCDGVTNTITFSIGTDQMNCAKAFAALPATTCASLTVGQFESCVTDIYAETCDSFATSPPSCAPVYACLIGP